MKAKNKERAERGAAAVEAYKDVHPDGPSLNTDSLIGDLIADLLHYAQGEGLNATTIVRMGEIHYEEER